MAIPNLKLDMEVDGREFHLDTIGNHKVGDIWRDNVIESPRWTIFRFWAYELKEDMVACVAKVVEFCAR
jgi:very-short-patch-repair endonuclease